MHSRDSVCVGPFMRWELDSLGLWRGCIPSLLLPAQAKRRVRVYNVLTYMCMWPCGGRWVILSVCDGACYTVDLACLYVFLQRKLGE